MSVNSRKEKKSKKLIRVIVIILVIHIILVLSRCTVMKEEYVTKEVYKDCENSSIEFYAVESKHTWPGSIHDTIGYLTGHSVSATDLVWEFFSRHKKYQQSHQGFAIFFELFFHYF